MWAYLSRSRRAAPADFAAGPAPSRPQYLIADETTTGVLMAPAGREKTWDHAGRGSAHAAHAGQETNQSTGLYDPSFEHDACGVAFIADLTGRPGHDVVSKALTALCNLEHRGAQGGDPGTGDGAGILTQIPDAFFREVCDFDLPPAG